MSSHDPDDAFVERLRAAYEPPEMTEAHAARFDRRLAERRQRRRWVAPTLVLAGAAAAFALWLGPQPPAPEQTPRVGAEPAVAEATQPTAPAEAPAEEAVVARLSGSAATEPLLEGLYQGWADTEVGGELWADDEVLPADYEMIAMLLEPSGGEEMR